MPYSKEVEQQQIELNKKGANLVVDGILGPKTQAAIAKYSTSNAGILKTTPPPITTPTPKPDLISSISSGISNFNIQKIAPKVITIPTIENIKPEIPTLPKQPKATFADLAQVPSYALSKFIIEPTYNFLSTGKELVTGTPLPKLDIPALTKNFSSEPLVSASSYGQKYQEQIDAGVPEKDAYRNTLIGGIMDAIQLVSPIKETTKFGLKTVAPTTLIKPSLEKVSKTSLTDYFSGRKTAEQLGFTPEIKNEITSKMKAMSTQEKVQFLQGFDLLSAKPSTIGKMFGVGEQEAKNILSDTYGQIRQSATGELPGYTQYKPNPQAGSIDLGGGSKKGKPVGFGESSNITQYTPKTPKTAPETTIVPKVENIPKYDINTPTLKAFAESKPIEEIGQFQLGTFGENSANRKIGQVDRFPKTELPETIKNITQSYRASDNPNNYRYDNIAHIAEMPNGEKRVIYTRQNSQGKDEIINWHSLASDKAKSYIDTLKSYGASERNRTSNLLVRTEMPYPFGHGSNKSITKPQIKNNISNEIISSQKTTGVLPQEKQPTPILNIEPSTIEKYQKNIPVQERGLLKPTEVVPKSSLQESIPFNFNPDKYVAEQIANREKARISESSGIITKAKNFLADAKTKLVDFTAPIEDVLNQSVRKNKITLLPEEDIHNQIDRVLRSPTIAGQFAKDNGIVDVIRKVDNLDNLDQYLIAKHAIELDTRGINTGRNLENDIALVKSFYPKYEQYANIISQYSQKLLDYSVETGLINKDLADILKQRYPDYVPFQRVFSELEKSQGQGGGGVASLSKQTIIQKIEGSDRAIESPIESLLLKTNDVFKQGEKNLAGKLLASYEKLPDNPFQLKEIEPNTKGETGGTISFFDNGEKRTFQTTPEIAQAAKSLNVQQLNILGKIFALPTRIARVGITGINLPFIGANIAKDAVSAFINSNHSLATSIANPVNFVKSLFSAVGHNELYKEMVRAGGAGTSFDISRNQVTKSVASIRASKNIGSKALYTVTHPSELLTAIENIIGRGEEFTRIQQYRGTKETLLKKGMTEKNATISAARQAREATVNFARRGEWGSVLNSAFLYLNASIQGTRTLLRNLKNKPIQTGIKIVISALFPVALATAWNLSDPKRKEAYDDIAEYEKQNNIIIIPDNPVKDENGKWNIIKIPLSQEINNLVGMVRKPIESAYGSDPIKFSDFANALIGTVSPIAPNKGSILSTITPQAIKPTIEAATNTNLFTGFPQVSPTLEKLTPEKQIKSNTSGTARQIGEKLHLSPIKVEEFIKGTFGGVGSQTLNVVDRVLAKTGVIPKDQIHGQNILDAISARFSKASGGKIDDKSIQSIQELLQKQADTRNELKVQAETLDNELKNLPPEQAKIRFQEIKASNPDLASKLVDVVEERKLGLTFEEKLMKQLGVENGERAKYIDQQIMKLPPEKRANYYNELLKKKVISPKVAQQISMLKRK